MITSGSRRLALILDTLDPTERNWHKCPRCGTGWATAFECRPCAQRSAPSPTPFVSASGSVMGALLANHGIRPEEHFIGTVDEPALTERLAAYAPHMVLLIGTEALRAFHGSKVAIDDWRGSVFTARGVLPGVKCLATFSPERLRKDYSLTGVVRFDLDRARTELEVDGIEVLRDTIAVDCTVDELIERLQTIRTARQLISVDIEGYVDFVSCVGFATSANEAFVVPLMRIDNTSWWTQEEECRLWEAMAEVLSDLLVPKVLQNSLYDCFVLAWSYGIVVRGVRDDTMFKHFELYCELEKKLAFQVSIYTKHSFYKSERNSTDEREKLEYCGKDCCRTFEINFVLERKLSPRQQEHYQFNMALLAPCLYMELRGMRYDKKCAKKRLREVEREIWQLQDAVNLEAARGRPKLAALYGNGSIDMAALVPLAVEAFCKARRMQSVEVEETRWQPRKWNGKKFVKAGRLRDTGELLPGEQAEGLSLDPVTRIVTRNVPVEITDWSGVLAHCKESCLVAAKRVWELLVTTGYVSATRAEIASLLGLFVNVNSTNQGGDSHWYLYEHLKLPKQHIKERGRNTERLSSDTEAVLKAYAASKDERALTFLALRHAMTRTKALQADVDSDGRMRCSYNLVGTETVRLSCSESPTGGGFNLQTVTKRDRDLFIADEGCLMAQCDLAGADGWTVAARCAQHGDSTMLDDYRAQMKPARITALLYERGPQINQLSRPELQELCKTISGDGWLYQGCKRVQHGTSYLMGPNTMSDQLLSDSYKLDGKPLLVEPKTCKAIQQRAFLVRYPGIPRWHMAGLRQLKEIGSFTSLAGHKRLFYGRKSDNSTLGKYLAHEPQFNTTYATKLALLNGWRDPENRLDSGALRCEPLHTVHDSVIWQFQQLDRPWASAKIHGWFQNELLIGYTKLVIPFEGTVGMNWREQKEKL